MHFHFLQLSMINRRAIGVLAAVNPLGSGQDGGAEHETEYTNTEPVNPFLRENKNI